MTRNTIAVCIVKMDENFQADAVSAITKRAGERGLNVEIYNSFEELSNGDSHDIGEESIFELIDYRHLYGIIFFPEKIKSSRVNENIVKYASAHNIPIVAIDREVPGCISITFDYTNAFEEIVEHLISVHNCKNFYIMAGIRNNFFSDERVEAALKVIRRHGLDVPEENIGHGDFWEIPTRIEMQEFFDSGRPLPDAFVAANDTMAMIICDELNRRGIRVPEDCIVTGFDGIEAERYAVPRLTTAETDFIRCGCIAVDSILGYDNLGERTRHIVVPFHTRFSQSCGCAVPALSQINGRMQELYNDLSLMKVFVAMMASMLTRMCATDNLLDMAKLIDWYRQYIGDYEMMYVCIRRSVASADSVIEEKLVIPDELKGLPDDDGQMVLLAESKAYEETKVPLTVFRSRDLLPDRNNKMKELKNLVLFPIHIQDVVYGYVAASVMPHEQKYNYYEMAYFTRNLSQAISDVLSTIQIKRSNEDLKAANKKLGEISETDYLTGLNNRRGFFNRFEIMRRYSSHKYVAVASIDLNGLKMINDKYGHAEGDRAICLISEVLREMMDDDCICARFGGDEFSFCKFTDDENIAEGFSERFKKLIEEVNEREKPEYLFSASCGMVLALLYESEKLDKLLSGADEKMYVEKSLFHSTHREYEKRRADRR